MAALKLETRGDPVRARVWVLLGGAMGGSVFVEGCCCYTAALGGRGEEEVARSGAAGVSR